MNYNVASSRWTGRVRGEWGAPPAKTLLETVRTDDGGGADKRYDQKEFVIGSQ